MAKQKINFLNPKTGKRSIGCLDHDADKDSDNVHTSDGSRFNLNFLKKENQEGGIGYFETCKEGKVIQKTGKFKK